jgi:hypothetical protein
VPWNSGNPEDSYVVTKIDQLKTLHAAHAQLMRIEVKYCPQCRQRHPGLEMHSESPQHCVSCGVEKQNPGSVTMFSSANKLQLMPYDSPAGELSNQTVSHLNSIAMDTLLFRSLRPIEIAVLRLAIPCLSFYRFPGG